MAYCRFSTDDFKSHVYCYEHTHGGYVIVMASRQYDYKNIDLPAPIPGADFQAQYQRMQDVIRILKGKPINNIGLKHDGKVFYVDTLNEMKETLKWLEEVGYYIPNIVYERIDEEIEQVPESN